METAAVTPIDNLLWTATKYSDVLKIDRRVCQQALETAPHSMHGKRHVWHIRDGMPAIYRRVWNLSDTAGDQVDPSKLPPKDRLNHYQAERERLKFAQDKRVLLPAVEVEQVIGESIKVLAQTLDILPDTLERDAALAPEIVTQVTRTIDAARETLYEQLRQLTVKPDDPAE